MTHNLNPKTPIPPQKFSTRKAVTSSTLMCWDCFQQKANRAFQSHRYAGYGPITDWLPVSAWDRSLMSFPRKQTCRSMVSRILQVVVFISRGHSVKDLHHLSNSLQRLPWILETSCRSSIFIEDLCWGGRSHLTELSLQRPGIGLAKLPRVLRFFGGVKAERAVLVVALI